MFCQTVEFSLEKFYRMMTSGKESTGGCLLFMVKYGLEALQTEQTV